MNQIVVLSVKCKKMSKNSTIGPQLKKLFGFLSQKSKEPIQYSKGKQEMGNRKQKTGKRKQETEHR